MTYSFIQTQTFTATHAKHLASKVATDLKRIQRFYGCPSDYDISNYEAELIEFLKKGYLDMVTYGFKRNGNWIEPTLRYTARDLLGLASSDDDPGKVRPGANVDGASFGSYLTHNSSFDYLTEDEKNSFQRTLPFIRTGAPTPGIAGYLSSDRTYSSGGRALDRSSVKKLLMENNKPSFAELFEQAVEFPDSDMQERLGMLVGLDDVKIKLQKILGLLVNQDGILKWAKKHHPNAKRVINIVTRRPPLIVLGGDVGCGKSELAYTIGDAVARQEKIDVTLFPLSLSTRGEGRVGQMTQLISAAFEYTMEKAKKLKSHSNSSKGAVILFVDEADALAQSRENDQMHHEDKAGVNAFIRGIDSLGNGKLPAAVIMCTNRPNALDPAIKRRAAEIFIFRRPEENERHQVLDQPLTELGLNTKEINRIVSLTGPSDGRDYGFTFSDLTQRVMPSIILDAYPDKAINAARAIEVVKEIIPTSPFKEN